MDEISKYIIQKRLQIILNTKFDLEKNIQPKLSGEAKSIKAVYMELFSILDNIIDKESKFLNDLSQQKYQVILLHQEQLNHQLE